MLKKEQYELIDKIIGRATELNILCSSRVTALIDIEKATEHFNLRLEDFLAADVANFAHDFIGIQANIDRQSDGKNFNLFVPRFSGEER